jgi:hypothetical protein
MGAPFSLAAANALSSGTKVYFCIQSKYDYPPECKNREIVTVQSTGHNPPVRLIDSPSTGSRARVCVCVCVYGRFYCMHRMCGYCHVNGCICVHALYDFQMNFLCCCSNEISS